MKYAIILKFTGIALFFFAGLSILRTAQAVLTMQEVDSHAISTDSAGCLIDILLCVLGGYLFNRAKRL